MSSGSSIDIRVVIFLNQAAEAAYRGLPDDVRQAADAGTTAIQNHARLPRDRRQSLSGDLAGIDEVRIAFDGDAYRVYYLVEFKAAIYILDAGMKKSPRAGEIPQPQVDRLIARRKVAREDYARNKGFYEAAMHDRLERRKAWEAANNLNLINTRSERDDR
jgi:phage-related protein